MLAIFVTSFFTDEDPGLGWNVWIKWHQHCPKPFMLVKFPTSVAEFPLPCSLGGMQGMERRLWPVTSTHPSQHKANCLVKPRVQATFKILLETASDPRAQARLLATTTKESGAWLHALPISSLGLRMDDKVVRIAVGLRLGVPLCQPHNCYHCGAAVDELATHGLSCPKSQGRHPRHTAINELIQRSLVTAVVPSHLEPSGICRSDGKRPDGLTVTPWKCGRALTWDVICPDTFTPSHVMLAQVKLVPLQTRLRLGRRWSMPICSQAIFLFQWQLRQP